MAPGPITLSLTADEARTLDYALGLLAAGMRAGTGRDREVDELDHIRLELATGRNHTAAGCRIDVHWSGTGRRRPTTRPATAPAWSILTLTTMTGYVVVVQDQPHADWMVWYGPSAPDSATSSLRYHDPDAPTAAAVAVFPSSDDANAAWFEYRYGGLRPPRRIPYAALVVPLSRVAEKFGAAT